MKRPGTSRAPSGNRPRFWYKIEKTPACAPLLPHKHCHQLVFHRFLLFSFNCIVIYFIVHPLPDNLELQPVRSLILHLDQPKSPSQVSVHVSCHCWSRERLSLMVLSPRALRWNDYLLCKIDQIGTILWPSFRDTQICHSDRVQWLLCPSTKPPVWQLWQGGKQGGFHYRFAQNFWDIL